MAQHLGRGERMTAHEDVAAEALAGRKSWES